MSLICAFTVPCAAIPCSNIPIQGACINKLRHRRLQKFHHPILTFPARTSFRGSNLLNLSTLSSEGAHFAQIKKGEKRAKQDVLFLLKNKFLSNNETEINWSSCSRKTTHVQLCRTSLGNVQEHNVDYFLQSQPLFPARRQIEAGMCSWEEVGRTRRRKDRSQCSVVPWLWGWLSTVACSHGFSKSIYLCTCHNLSTVVRQADIFNTFHICNGICFKTYDNEMQKYCAIFHTHTALHTSLIRNNSWTQYNQQPLVRSPVTLRTRLLT